MPHPTHNLPASPVRLIGREDTIAAVQDLLARDEVHLLTLTGPAGVGKTSLGLEIATRSLDRFPHGVFFVSLAPLVDPTLVLPTFAQALGLREPSSGSLAEVLKDYLRKKRLLVVLDNFEHLLPAAPQVAELLAAATGLKVLVTSRAPLRLRGEQQYPVPPLPVPDLQHLPPAPDLIRNDTVSLFVARARGVSPSFELTPDNSSAVAGICCRLDGLPLAIELAAARIKVLPPQALLARLERRLPVLTEGARDLPSRQQTLRGAIAWSYDLLSEAEKTLFRRLAVFVGGCTLEAAEAVCNGNSDPGINVLDGVASLVDKSLLQQKEQEDGEPRFTMLETIRQYSCERLDASGEATALRQRHAQFFLRLAEEERADTDQWSGHNLLLDRECDNLRAALSWSHDDPKTGEMCMRLAGALTAFWHDRGYQSEGRDWMEKALARAGATKRTTVWVKVAIGLGNLAWSQGDFSTARALQEEAVSVAKEIGDKRGLAWGLHQLGVAAMQQGDWESAHSFSEKCLAVARELGDKHRTAMSLGILADYALNKGDLVTARSLHEEVLALLQEMGDRQNIRYTLMGLAAVAVAEGDDGAAKTLFEESLAISREVGHKGGIAASLRRLGDIAARQGDHAAAHRFYGESLSLRWEMGEKSFVAGGLENLARLAGAVGRPERAARLFGAAEALREAISFFAFMENEGRDALRVGVSAPAWAEGRAMSVDEAVRYALERTDA